MLDLNEIQQKMDETHFYLCWGCDIPVEVVTDSPILRVFCPECKEEYAKNKKETLEKYIELKIMVMHERALRYLEKQYAKLYKYKDASEVILEAALDDPEKFMSSHEMIAAMEMVRNRIKVKTQQKIGSHRVDFVIPQMKVVLEVDGYMHDYSKIKDSNRDVEVRKELGEEWEIVRIPTKYLEKNASKLITAIKEVYKYKKEIRKSNYGLIPSWYSEREKERYKHIFN